MTADRRAHTDDKPAHSPFGNSENANRAALVEKVARAMEKADSHAYEYQLTSSWEHLAETAIDLIRAEVLEEAAGVADATTAFDDNVQKSAGCWTTGQRIAAAIRSLKGDKP